MAQKIIVISGPTASGKSGLAVDLALQHNGEIINADSVQVYRHFDIGAAKPDDTSLRAVPHHLFSVLDPAEPFDANIFRTYADEAICDVLARGKLPCIVGGSGLYLKSLLHGLAPIAAIDSQRAAAFAAQEAELIAAYPEPSERAEKYHQWLQTLDPSAANRLHPADTVRIRRALAVVHGTGTTLSEIQALHAHGSPRYDALVIALFPEREALYHSIDVRVDQMLAAGLLAEGKSLLDQYPESKALGAIGYRHVVQHLRGEIEYEEMVRQLKRDTRHFAKRQTTWWNNQPRVLGWHTFSASGDISDPKYNSQKYTRKEILQNLCGVIPRFISGGLCVSGIAFLPLTIVDM